MQFATINRRSILSKLNKTKPSSPGMDSISPLELQLLVAWCPHISEHLASLLNLVERTGRWPDQLPKGAVIFIPKSQEANPAPTDFRPLTILSSIYRLWAATRHDQLCQAWLPKWQSSSAYGLKQSNAADALAFQTCLQTQLDMQAGNFTSGISLTCKNVSIPYLSTWLFKS